MSYYNYESSREQGIPASLFHIQWGSEPANFFAYSDSDVDIIFEGVTYQAIPIGRADVGLSGSLDNSTLEIDIHPNTSLVEFYEQKEPSQVVSMTIRSGHVTDPNKDYQVIWTGRIISVVREDIYAKIAAEPVATSMQRTGLRRNYQYGCLWPLYGKQCRAVRTKHSAVVSALEGNRLSVPSGWTRGQLVEKFLGGYVQWRDVNTNSLQTRGIAHAADTGLTLRGRIFGLGIGQGIDIYLGCNHQLSDCRDLHNNVVNFGGQPWIPRKNPTLGINRYV